MKACLPSNQCTVPENTKLLQAQTCLGVVGGCMFCMACILDGKGLIHVALRMCPRYWISLEKKLHLLFFMERLADLSFRRPS